jgi:uncharacterized protein YdhG (YjbR/CyaY superfamily)
MITLSRSAVAYFEELPEERQGPMVMIRQLIRHQWPAVKEDMANGMPTYHLQGEAVFALSNQKNHITFYVIPFTLLNAFRNDLRTRNCGRSCIRFRRLESEDLALLERIIRYVGATFKAGNTSNTLNA